jgi:putative hydrolase of the HAD superfamily
MAKPTLIMDVGGVLMEDAFPAILHEILLWIERSRDSPPQIDDVLEWYRQTLRSDLWSGRISLEAFWHRLGERVGTDLDPAIWNHRIQACRKPLPSILHVADWSHKARIILLTNHRHEWLMPLLETYAIRPAITSVLCSDMMGFMKPDPQIYRIALSLADNPERALFIDDKQRNLDGATAAGLAWLQADDRGEWVAKVDQWLSA